MKCFQYPLDRVGQCVFHLWHSKNKIAHTIRFNTTFKYKQDSWLGSLYSKIYFCSLQTFILLRSCGFRARAFIISFPISEKIAGDEKKIKVCDTMDQVLYCVLLLHRDSCNNMSMKLSSFIPRIRDEIASL